MFNVKRGYSGASLPPITAAGAAASLGDDAVAVADLLTGITVASSGVELEFNNVHVAPPPLAPASGLLLLLLLV
uniref:Uncharacterized protein n=1 Tax=Anopheles quadriannulatus TaxID=34691 RepID=A0A182WWN1_ANOQN